MPKRVLGLDVGSHAIKATIVEGGMRAYRVVEYAEIAVPRESPAPETPARETPETISPAAEREAPGVAAPPAVDHVAALVRRLLAGNDLRFDEAVVALPSEIEIDRVVRLPFAQRKKIEMVLADEMDDLTVFDVEGRLLRYQLLDSRTDGSTVLACLTHPDAFRAFLASLQDGGVDPAVVDVRANALAALAVSENFPDAPPVAVVDIGARRTVVAVVAGGRLAGLRTFAFGGERITEALAEARGVPRDEAERLKIESGRVAGNEPEESESGDGNAPAITRAITGALGSLVAGLLQTFHAIDADAGVSPSRIALGGGTAALRGLAPFLEAALGVPVVPLAPLDSGIDRTIAAGAAQQARMAVSLGLALRQFTARRADRLNLRGGEFAFHGGGGAGLLRSKVRELAIMGGVLVLLLAVQAILGYSTYAGQAARIDAQLREVYAKSFPGQPAVQPLKQFEGNVARLQTKAALLSGLGDGSLTALGILRELSARIPATVKVDLSRLEIGPEAVRLEGLTDDFNSVDQIESALGQVPGFLAVQKDQAAKAGGEKIKFKFTISLTETKGAAPSAASGGGR
jgi:type IV pilus assembly protein PilM